jgi:hypothetical protein
LSWSFKEPNSEVAFRAEENDYGADGGAKFDEADEMEAERGS